jgi:hypothetical protein
MVRMFRDPEIGIVGAQKVAVNTPDHITGLLSHLRLRMEHELCLEIPRLGEMIAFRKVFDRIPPDVAMDEAFVEALVVRNGLRAVSVGTGKDGMIDVPFIPASADIQNGDVFVTSGIDGLYPPGLAVATITSVEKNAAFQFARITGKPASGADSHRYVMVLNNPSIITYPTPDVNTEERKASRDKTPRNRRDGKAER